MNAPDYLSPQQITALLALAGIGGAPDFELIRLRLLGWHETNFTK